jgi:Chemoreceptor zinc-binding domain
MSWFSSLFGSSENKEFASVEKASEEIGGLNFKTALEAHIKWKQRLKGVIDGTGTEVLDPRVVSKDNECVLGKWLYSAGHEKFGKLPVFREVVEAHAHFHKCAGHTLELALNGKYDEAEKELTGGSFAKASLTVTRHLLRLWKDVGIEH